jgi:hypothetical protein
MSKDLRWYDGAFKLLAKLALQAKVSKPIIDYYTNLELSETNSYESKRSNIQNTESKLSLNYQEVTPFLLKPG